MGAVEAVVVAGLEAVVVVVVEVAGLVADFGAAVGLCAKAREAVAQRTADTLSKCVGLISANLVEAARCESSLGFGRTVAFLLVQRS